MRIIIIILAVLFISSCSTPGRFIVSEMGYEPAEVSESIIYALPHTGLKVKMDYRKDIFIPGPYADYALKLLGIDCVKKNRSETYLITSAELESITEPDAGHFYSINNVEGKLNHSFIDWAKDNHLILTGDFHNYTNFEILQQHEEYDEIPYKDVTMEPNTEIRKETIYKKVLTDTSFIEVPVTSEQIERKSLENKAEEAAKLILEIRSDRYFISAGLLDPFPDNFDMQTALATLDRLEDAYLSLFIGKLSSTQYYEEYFIIPEGDLTTECFELDKFSCEKGMGIEEGEPITLTIHPTGNSKSFRNLLPQEPEPESYNRFYYRIPEICEIQLTQSDKVLYKNRLSIYQSGALVNMKIAE